MGRCLGQMSKGSCRQNLQKCFSWSYYRRKVYFGDWHVMYLYVNAAYLSLCIILHHI